MGIVDVDGDSAQDRVRVTAVSGAILDAGTVPEFSDSGEAPGIGEPDNLLSWGVRGRQDDALVERPAAGFAAVAILLTDVPGRTTDELVVLTRPGASRLGYGAESNDHFRFVEPAPGLDGISAVR